MPLYNEENQTKRKSLMADSENQRFLEEGRLEVKDRLARSSLFNPESFTKDLTDDDYIKFGKERIDKQTTSWGMAIPRAVGTIPLRIGEAAFGGVQRIGESWEKERQEIKDAIGLVQREGAPIPQPEREMPPLEAGKGFGTFLRSLAGRGVKEVSRGVRAIRETVPVKLAKEHIAKARLDEARIYKEVSPEVAELFKKGDEESLVKASQLLQSEKHFAQKSFAEKVLSKRISEIGEAASKYFRETAEELRPITEPGTLKYYASTAIESVGSTMGPALIATLATKKPGIGLSIMFPQVYGQAYSDQRSEGKSVTESTDTALMYAITEVLSEGVPLGIITKQGGRFITRVLKGATAESIQEGLNEAVQIAYDEGIIGKDTPSEEIGQRLLDAGIIGAIGGTGMGVISHGVARKETTDEEATTAKKDVMEVITDALKAKEQTPEQAFNSIREGYESGLFDKSDLDKVAKQYPNLKQGVAEIVETAANQQAAANVHDIINEGMAEGNIMGEPFTPDTAFEIIDTAYADKIITTEDIDLFKEQYPDLRPGLNDIIGKGVGETISQEIEDAERIRREVEEASIKERVDREAEESIRVRRVKEDRLEAEKREAAKIERKKILERKFEKPEKPIEPIEEKPKEPKIEKPKVAEKEPHEMTVKELAAKEADWFKGKQYLIPRDKFKKIGIERNFIKKDGDYYYILANGEIGNKVEKEIYDQRIKEGIESHKYYIEKAISEGKPVPKEVLAEYPDLAPAKPKEVIKLKPSEILKPDIEAKYGKFLEKVGKRLKSEAIGQDILDSLEATKISPTKVSKTFWEDTFFKLPEGAQNNIKKYLTSLTGMKPGDVMATLKGKDIKAKDWMDIADVVEKDLTKIEHLEGTERGYIALMAYANEQVKTIPAKPITPKPPKPTAPEAIEKEIKAEPIPEVAPKPPVKPKKEPKVEAPVEKEPILKTDEELIEKERFLYKQGLSDISIRMLEQAKRKADIDYNRTIEVARKVASLENEKLSQEHVAEAIQYAIEDFAIIDQVINSKQEVVDGKTIWRAPNGQDFTDILERVEEVFGVKPKEKVKAIPEKVPTKPEPGKAWIKGKQKPILSAREITRGKNKGKYEIVLTRGRDAEGNIIPGVKRVVEKKAIITMPKEIKPYEKPTKKELEVKEAIPAAEGRAVYTDKKIKTEFPEVVSDRAGSYKSGVKTIVAPQDAAAFAHLNLSKYPQEHLASVILDKDRKIISVHRYSIGAPGQAPFSPSLIAGHALNTPDAANLIIVHNHPSGDPMLSIADVGAFDGIKNTLKGTSIKANDIIAVGESEYSSYAEGQTRTKIPDVRAKYEIPMVERVFKQRGKNLYKVSDEDSAVKFGKDHLPEGGLIFLNPKNNAVGVLPIDDYSRLREGTSEIILKQVDATNAVNIIAYEPDTSIPESEKTNLQEFANATDLHLLDIIDDQGSWQAAGVMPTTKGTKFFATKATKPQDTITRQDLQSIFGKMKNVRTGVNAKGNFYFGVEGKPAIEILETDSIGGYINTDKGRIPVGSYLKNTIELKTTGVGPTADVSTAFHEYMHFLEKNSIVTPNDIKALDSAIGKVEVTEEDRATYVGDRLAAWQAEKNTRIKRILKKISDFANAVYEFFTRTRTARGVLRDIEAGKILAEKKAVGVPTEEKVFQAKPKRDYKEWIKLYAEEKAKKAKTKTDSLGKVSLDKEVKRGAIDTQKTSDSPSSPEGFNMPSEGKGRQVLDTVQWKMQDRLIHLKKVQDVIEKTTELPDSSNVYQTEELYHYKTTKRINDADSDLFDPLVESISKSKHDLEDVELFLRARHAQEANKRLQEINPNIKDNTALSGMSNVEALKIRKQYMGDIAMYDIAKQIDSITKATRQILVKDGLATKEEIKAWENAYQYYIPLKREGKGSELPKKGRGMYVGGKESKMRLTGSEKLKPVNIVANIMAQHESTIIRAEKAKVGRAMLKLAQEHPNKDLWVADAPELKPFLKMRKGEIISKEITDDIALYAAEHEKEYLDKVTGLPVSLSEVVYGRDILYKFADNVLVTKIDGVEHTVTFNEQNVHANRIVRSLKNLGADNSNAAINVLSKVNRVLAMVNTSYNPEFIISNFARDIQTAGYNINDTQARNVKAKVFKDVGKAWQGIRQGVRGKYTTEWAKHYEAFEKSGAQTGWIDYYKNIEAREKTLKKKLATLEEGNWPATKRAFKSVFEFIDNENTAVENAIRLSTYKHMKDLGISDAKAASAAKNLTVNFNRRGDAGQALNALYLFFNANVQGSVRLIYAAAKSPTVRKMMLGTVGFAVMLDLLNRSLGGEDDDGENKYDKVPVWVKEHNMVIMRSNGDYFKIPLPWGYNTLHVLGQVIGESVDPTYKKDFSAISSAGRLGGAVLASFNPLGSESSLLQIASPTLVDPFIQWAENQNFAGIPLRPEQNPFDVPKPEYQMYFSNARDPSKWAAKQLNDLTGGDATKPGLVDVSPEVFDLFIDMFTGGAGRFLDNTLRLPMTLTEKDVDVRHIPFARRMYGEPSEFAARTTFYDNLNDIRYAEKSVNHYQNIRDFDGLKKARKNNMVELRFIDRAKGVKKSVDELRKQQKQIEKTTFAKEIKTKRIENIEQQIRQIIDRFNKQYFEAKHK